MALFKIFKGSKDNLGQAPGTGLQDTRLTHEGFAYFTPEDGKFYIDIADSNSAVVGTNRIPISADKADKDASGNVITSTYLTKAAGVTNVAWNSTNKKLTKTINGSTTDVVTIGTIKTALALAKSDVGLGNVANIDLSKAIKSITRSGTTFTYTCLDDTTGTFTLQDNNTATAADNILDGSNSDTQITYAPYATQQSKLSFDTSTDFPTRIDRLNLNGVLYATKFLAEHLKNDAGEYTVTYGDTVDMWLGVGSGNTNHGLYDRVAGKWMIVADSNGAVTVNGNATTATGFVSAKTIALTGNVTGSATGGNSSNGWSIATTIGTGVVTNAMLAGSIANGKLTNSKVTIAGNEVSLGGSLTADILRSSLGLSSAMHFIGLSEDEELEDGWTGTPDITSGVTYSTKLTGDVVLRTDTNEEFVWSGHYWELLGRDTSFKVVQTPVTTATEETDTATTFVHSVTQDANGNITVKTRPLPPYNNYSLPVAKYNVLGGLKPAYTTTGAATVTAASNTSTPTLSARTTTAGRYYAIEADKNGVPFVNVPWTDTNKYHKTGSWSGLTYTATAVNSADELKFTIPTASTSTAGAMTTDMVTKLNGIQESADAVSFTRSLTSGTKIGTITINGSGTDIYAPTNTDTKNTAGSTDTSSKIFLIGATEQSANPQTYSDDLVFTTSGVLTAKELVLSQTGARSITFSRTDGYNYIQTPEGGGVAICATDSSVSLIGSTLLVNATNVRPGQTDTYDLGTSSYKRKTSYVTTLNSNDIIVDNLTASQAVVTDANKKLVSRAIKNITTAGTLGWTTSDVSLVTVNTIAYWNGAYKDTTSNLKYSVNGEIMGLNSAQTVSATKTFSAIQKFTNTTDSAHSTDTAAAVSISGGLSVAKQVSAKLIRIDNASSSEGILLVYDSTDNSINFNFI